MGTPPTVTMEVINSGSTDIFTGGQEIAANGGSYTFSAADIPAVVSDVNFRAPFLAGYCSIVILGETYSNATPNIEDFLDQLAQQNITV